MSLVVESACGSSSGQANGARSLGSAGLVELLSHARPQYSQVRAALEIALVQPSHRFQVICGTFHGQVTYQSMKTGLFCVKPGA